MAVSLGPKTYRKKISAIYQIGLYCDVCGKEMHINPNRCVLASNPPQFFYECPFGHSTISNVQFPIQQMELDEDSKEEVDLNKLFKGESEPKEESADKQSSSLTLLT